MNDFQLFVQRMFFDKERRRYVLGSHHRQICSALRRVANGECNRLIINIAPRYGKTLLVSQMFIAWGFALNPASKFIHLSYSRDLVRANAQAVKDICLLPYYQYLYGDRVQIVGKSAQNWATTMGGKMYAVSSGGQVTGFGAGEVEDIEDSAFAESKVKRFAGAIVIDDALKPDDALSDKAREFINYRFESTIRSRANSRNTPIVIIMQRLHEKDLCGYLMQNEPNEWEILSLPCITESGEALWEFKHTIEELNHLREVNPYIFDTQYMQNPTPREGLMYERFRTYDTLPLGAYIVKNYTDTADTGSDYLCSITYAEYPNGECFVLDILYTDKPMEYTETETAKMLNKHNCRICVIESNNGGRGFRRNVERLVRESGNRATAFVDFTQRNNKYTRIFSHSAEVQNMIYYPNGWEWNFALYAQAMKGYRKMGSNAHDDAPDATTGVIEQMSNRQRTIISRT